MNFVCRNSIIPSSGYALPNRVSQNGVLTACPSFTACSSRGCSQRLQKHPSSIAMIKAINVGIDPKGIDPGAESKVGIDPKGTDPGAESKVGIDPKGTDPGAESKVGIDPKGIDPGAESKVGIDPKGTDPGAESKVGIDPKGLQYAQGAYRMNSMVQRRLPSGLAGCMSACSAGLQGARALARQVARCTAFLRRCKPIKSALRK
ncbi:hypothetical protein CDL15_Pgr005075 [Punica granatum]|uniref:Uncharacterized protein n=1 Tax=Punica granatum TaxID=22663 RepID=A0A218XEB0_PUNGR|nr:hypothetical protein CDL15_Pgr005075 [Punica granatum]